MSTPIRIALENLIEDLSLPSIAWPSHSEDYDVGNDDVIECLQETIAAVSSELRPPPAPPAEKKGEAHVAEASLHGFVPYFEGREAQVEAVYYVAQLLLRQRIDEVSKTSNFCDRRPDIHRQLRRQPRGPQYIC